MKLPRITAQTGVPRSHQRWPTHAEPTHSTTASIAPATYTLSLTQWSRWTDCLAEQGLVYYCPEGRNDCFIYVKDAVGGKESFHVHSIETFKDSSDQIVLERLLTKSGSFRSGNEPDLATLKVSAWKGAVSGMDSKTKQAVAGMVSCFESMGITDPD